MEAETSAGESQNNIHICLNMGDKVISTLLKRILKLLLFILYIYIK